MTQLAAALGSMPMIVLAVLLAGLLLSGLRMASAVASERIGSRVFEKSFDHDPGATAATLGAPDGGATPWSLDMGLYEAFGCLARPTVLGGGGGGITKLEIVAADDAALATNLTVIKDSGVVAADALADVVFLECLASEVRQLSTGSKKLRWVGVRVTCGHAGDEANLHFIGWAPRFPRSGLTATAIT